MHVFMHSLAFAQAILHNVNKKRGTVSIASPSWLLWNDRSRTHQLAQLRIDEVPHGCSWEIQKLVSSEAYKDDISFV